MKPYLLFCLPKVVIEQTLHTLAPLRIHLAEPKTNNRWIELNSPQEVVLEPGLGVRVVTSGHIKFEMANVHLPAYLEHIVFRLTPKIVQTESMQRAVMTIEILDIDLKFTPNLVDEMLVAQVNKALLSKENNLLWRFDETLSKQFKITEYLQPLQRIGLKVVDSEIEINSNELLMRVFYKINTDTANPA